MYAALPAFLYLNTTLFAAMLAPLLEAQDSMTGQLYASPDLGQPTPKLNIEWSSDDAWTGTSYPLATGAHGMAIEGVEGGVENPVSKCCC